MYSDEVAERMGRMPMDMERLVDETRQEKQNQLDRPWQTTKKRSHWRDGGTSAKG